jgi:diacylglycerol kinase family enzyme
MKTAIVLNGNARAVTGGFIERVKAACREDEHVFMSKSLEHSKEIAKQIINDEYRIVMCGGGDGTFSQCVTDIYNLKPDRLPAFGILRCGTGNALADVLGVGGNCKDTLEAARNTLISKDLSLVRIGDKIAPFAGLGIDALILEDYEQVKGELNHDPMFKMIENLRGSLDYGLAISLMSLWKVVNKKTKSNVIIKNVHQTEKSFQIDEQGWSIGPEVEENGIVYNGSASMVAVSTVPYYGMGFKMFPQVNPSNPGFQLRVINLKVRELLMNFPFFLMSDMFHNHISDFVCSAVTIKTERNVPFQIGGNSAGNVNEVTIDYVQVPVVLGENKVGQLKKDNYR